MKEPEQAWNACLSQLQMEMPKSAFETWVNAIQFLSYEEGVFRLGVPNEYTRDWLRDRLASTATRLLTGIMNRQVEVEFTVLAQPIPPPSGEQETALPSAGDEQTALRIQEIHRSLCACYTQPDRVVMIPGYFKRWLPYLGPLRAWIIVALRQVMYLATGNLARPGVEFSAAPFAVARWAGIDRSTLWRHLDDPLLGWFLNRLPGDGNRYVFQANMPLTPGDAEHLRNLLVSAGIRTDPLAALDRVLSLEIGDLLPYPTPAPRPEHQVQTPNPLSVPELALRECGKLDKRSLKPVLEKAEQLALRLAPPNDRIYVSHYFLLNWLPLLGPAPAWFVTLLRDRCFVSRQEVRDGVWVWGGYPEIAAWLGIERPKTISEWLPPAFSAPCRQIAQGKRQNLRLARRNLLEQFVQRSEYLEGDGFLAWRFKVNLTEPLAAEDQAEYDQVLDLLGNYLESGDRQEIERLIADLDEGAIATHEGAFATSAQDTKARLQHAKARLQHADGAIATSRRRDCNALNTLKHLLNHLKHLEVLSTSTTGEKSAAGVSGAAQAAPVVVGEAWDLGCLLEHNRSINAQTRQALRQSQASAPAFVSWLLYAASPSGVSIRQPALFAASQLRQDPQRGAGEAYDRLAKLPPPRLLELLNAAISNPYQASHPDWRQTMSETNSKRLLALRRQLFATP